MRLIEKNIRFQFVVLLYFLIVSIGCSSESNYVAEFGNEKITLEEFRTAYLKLLKQPDFFDSKEKREKFLDDLIAFRLLANEAKKKDLHSDERIQYKIEAYKNKTLREAHYDYVIKPKIQFDENEIEETYVYTQEERRVSHLFIKTKKRADSIYNLLEGGKSFEFLASQIFNDDSLKNNGGDLGWITWDQFEYDLAKASFTLPVNKYSKPIKSSFGYHIIKVTDYKKKPLITRNEYLIHRKRAKSLLEYKIGDKIASEYVNKLVKSADVVMYPKIYYLVQSGLTKNLKRVPTQFDQMTEFQLSENEVKQIETNLWDSQNEIIATINGKDLTVGEFIGGIHYIPYENIYSNFNTTFKLIVRDFLLTEEAKVFQLDEKLEVNNKIKLFGEYLTQLKFRRKLIREQEVTEEDVEKAYKRNNEKYKKAKKEDVLPIIKNQLLNEKRRETVPNKIKELKQKLNIKTNLNIVHEYYDSILNKNSNKTDEQI